jgi:hypothetical protein
MMKAENKPGSHGQTHATFKLNNISLNTFSLYVITPSHLVNVHCCRQSIHYRHDHHGSNVKKNFGGVQIQVIKDGDGND